MAITRLSNAGIYLFTGNFNGYFLKNMKQLAAKKIVLRCKFKARTFKEKIVLKNLYMDKHSYSVHIFVK